mmetsp:Transcript_11780/g.19629  ORF Transcript_11780/g.19629 Transcript_11780/m.19629 type:complete len:108 (-) Transcript_11780:70-393(-)
MSFTSRFVRFWNHPVGPKTVHFWAPTWKWALVAAGLVDIKTRTAKQISGPQVTALSATGIIWARYSTQIRPVNYNLLAVNIFVGATGLYQMYLRWQGVKRGEVKSFF